MNTLKFNGFIDRYNLGGEVESVLIKSKDEKIMVDMISDDKTMLGSVSVKEKEFPEGEFGIYATSQLKGLLGVLDSPITVKEGVNSLHFIDKTTNVNYMLANESVIPSVPALKNTPEFEAQIKLNEAVVSKFIKAKNALPDSDTFTFKSDKDGAEIILGYSSINTNRISISVDAKCTDDVSYISFSSKYLKAILMANKNSDDSIMEISSKGLCHLKFENEEFNSEYFLVEIR